MKLIKAVTAVVALGLAAGGYAFAQLHHSARMHGTDDMVGHLGNVFGQFAAFDVNKDGRLDAGELESLGKAIENGSLVLSPPTPPKEAFPSEEQRLNHFADMYARFALYDANHDGQLDSAEQGAVKAAIENGQLSFPGEKTSSSIHQHLLDKVLHSR